ncbi:MAG: FAD-dependent oxidoreductase, partial [Rubrivivax sp.]|nr:FAD-dependent oxidoreductase [Rubrivivax sp.]
MQTTHPELFDIAIAGAGIVGATLAHALAPRVRVLLLEAEAAPGYHATGRSAALYAPSYGPPQVRALTRASRAFFDAPPAGFASVPLLKPRPTLFVGVPADHGALRNLHQSLLDSGTAAELISGAEARRRVPVLRAEACTLALLDPGSSDIDVDALLQGCLRSARAAGARLVTDARIVALQRQTDTWSIDTQSGQSFQTRVIVNAA